MIVPGGRVFPPFKSCPRGSVRGGMILDEIDTCIATKSMCNTYCKCFKAPTPHNISLFSKIINQRFQRADSRVCLHSLLKLGRKQESLMLPKLILYFPQKWKDESIFSMLKLAPDAKLPFSLEFWRHTAKPGPLDLSGLFTLLALGGGGVVFPTSSPVNGSGLQNGTSYHFATWWLFITRH